MSQSYFYCYRYELIAYLKAYHYTQTYRQNNQDAYYFGPKRSYVFVPSEKLYFGEAQILNIFKSGAEHIQDIEYARFRVFIHELRLKGT